MRRSEIVSEGAFASRVVAYRTPGEEDSLTITELHGSERAGSKRCTLDHVGNPTQAQTFPLPPWGEYALDQEQDLLAIYSQSTLLLSLHSISRSVAPVLAPHPEAHYADMLIMSPRHDIHGLHELQICGHLVAVSNPSEGGIDWTSTDPASGAGPKRMNSEWHVVMVDWKQSKVVFDSYRDLPSFFKTASGFAFLSTTSFILGAHLVAEKGLRGLLHRDNRQMTLNVFSCAGPSSTSHKFRPPLESDEDGFFYCASLELPPIPRQGAHPVAASFRINLPVHSDALGPSTTSMCRIYLLTDASSGAADKHDLAELRLSVSSLLRYTMMKSRGGAKRRVVHSCPE